MADWPNASWLVEDGIGEERALLVAEGRALAARVQWSGELTAGLVQSAVLVERRKGSGRGRARFPDGEEALVDKLPRDAAEGANVRLIVTRAAIGEAARRKPAQARPSDTPERPAPSLAEELGARVVRRFPKGLWEDAIADCTAGAVDFRGGSLLFSPTPAMVLVDVDGNLPPRDLALAAVDPLARAIALFGLGGSIGVDFPTLQAKDDRKAVDVALEGALADWDHERTAMNGFGFVQFVARSTGPSLLHRLHFQRTAAIARLLLRRAEGVSEPGTLLLTAHPAVLAHIGHDWLEQLARRTGRVIRTAADAGLAPDAAFAQAVPA